MLDAAAKALGQIFTPGFRAVLWRSLGITLALLIGIWFALQALFASFVVLPLPWLDTVVGIIAGLGMIVALMFLIGPITSLVAGVFLDEIAETVERTHYGADPPGRELPFAQSMWLAAKFTAVVVIVNVAALVLLLLPGINLIAFLVANGYLLGREYFEMAGLRHLPHEEVKALREANRGQVFAGGLLIAGFLAIPLLNLATPLFATAFMVHLFKRIEGRARGR
jgi:CysZ protein